MFNQLSSTFSGIFTPKKDDNTTPPSTILKDERTEAVSVLTDGDDTFYDAVSPSSPVAHLDQTQKPSPFVNPKQDENTIPRSNVLKDERMEEDSVRLDGQDTSFNDVGPHLSRLDTTSSAFDEKMPLVPMQVPYSPVARLVRTHTSPVAHLLDWMHTDSLAFVPMPVVQTQMPSPVVAQLVQMPIETSSTSVGNGFFDPSLGSGVFESPTHPKGETKTMSEVSSHTIIPVTVLMIHQVKKNNKDALVLQDGHQLKCVYLVGAIRDVVKSRAAYVVGVEDGSGLISVKVWINNLGKTEREQLAVTLEKNHQYVRVFGEVKDLEGEKIINASAVRPVTTGNMITHHMLNVVYRGENAKRSGKNKAMFHSNANSEPKEHTIETEDTEDEEISMQMTKEHKEEV